MRFFCLGRRAVQQHLVAVRSFASDAKDDAAKASDARKEEHAEAAAAGWMPLTGDCGWGLLPCRKGPRLLLRARARACIEPHPLRPPFRKCARDWCASAEQRNTTGSLVAAKKQGSKVKKHAFFASWCVSV